MPGMGGSYHSVNGSIQPSSSMPNAISPINSGHPGPYPTAQLQFNDFNGYSQAGQASQTHSPSTHDASMIDSFTGQPTSLAVNNFAPNGNHQVPSLQGPTSSIDQNVPPNAQQNPQFATPFIDPTDPSFFNFDISSLNFGNRYGALEFGMLGHMSSGAGEASDENGLLHTLNQTGSVPFDSSTTAANTYSTAGSGFNYPNKDGVFADWQQPANSDSRHNSTSQLFGTSMQGSDANNNFDVHASFPNAFAIGEGNGSISEASPGATGLDFGANYNSSPVSAANLFNHRGMQHQDFARQQAQQRQQNRNSFPPLTDLQGHDIHRKRKRDASHIYSSVQAPYSYTTGFHSLTAFLQKRFSPQKTVRIAKALASIRPSFISCTKELNRDDLIFMEKCFQRTLLQYEDFINAYGTPTVICRRTGEVAAVSKEFSLLTNWRRDLLLGKEPNLNVNTGGTSGNQTGTSSRGAATPRTANGSGVETVAGRPQPVFLAELLDDDSVIQFYEDFAKLAFGDSRGCVIKHCKLLKYKTKDDPGWGTADDGLANVKADPLRSAGGAAGTGMETRGISGPNPMFSREAGMNVLGEKNGKVDCMYCWSVKRDVFDIPMLIVMNVSLDERSH